MGPPPPPTVESFSSQFDRVRVDETFTVGAEGTFNGQPLWEEGPRWRVAYNSGLWFDPRPGVDSRRRRIRSEEKEILNGYRWIRPGFQAQVLVGGIRRHRTPLAEAPRYGLLADAKVVISGREGQYVSGHARLASEGQLATVNLSSGWPLFDGAIKIGPEAGFGWTHRERMEWRFGGVVTIAHIPYIDTELSMSWGWAHSTSGRRGQYLSAYAVRRW